MFGAESRGPRVALWRCVTTTARITASLSLCATLSLARGAAAQSDGYDDAMRAAAALEARGRHREAADALDSISARFPQDHALALRLGWLRFQSGDHAAARRHYERALSLSAGDSFEARLGLAWTLLRLGEASSSRAEFERALAASPDDASAREGLALARAAEPRPVRVWASLWTAAGAYAGHPQRRLALSVAPSVTLQFMDLVVAGATYRVTGYDFATPQPGRPPTFSWSAQQELYVSAGVARRDYALRLHLGRIWDASSRIAPATVLGATARFSLRGTLLFEASGASYTDYTALRAAGSWAARLSDAWSLGPVASAQYGNGTAGGSIGALVAWARDGFGASLSARYGDERRPTYLNESLTLATNDRVRAAVSVAGRAPLGRGLSLTVGYDWLRLTTGDAARPVDADAHYFSAGVTGAW